MTAKKSDRGAVLQFEINRTRWFATQKQDFSRESSMEALEDRLYNIAKTAVADTLRNNGTFVLVASDKTITMVQRPDAEELERP